MTAGKATQDHAVAYQDTNFTIFDRPKLVLRIGVDATRNAKWLVEKKAQSATVVTAWNPFSQSLPSLENETRQTKLLASIVDAKLLHLPAEGRDIQDIWPAEPSFCVFDASFEQVNSWMRDFEQNAVLHISMDGICYLLWHPDLA